MIGAAIVIMISEINKKNGVGYFSVFILINILSAMVINVLYSEKSIDAIVKLGIPRTAFLGALLGFYFIVIVVTIIFESSEVRIPIQHVMLNNTFSDEEYLAIKLNPAGTMPIMYTMTFFFLPYYLLKFLLKFFPDHKWMLIIYANLNLNSIWGILLYLILTAVLNYFLAQIMISPEEIAENMKKSGDYIPEMKPGKETKKLLDHVVFKTSMISSLSFAILSGIPLLVQYALKVQSPLFMMPLNFMILISIELTLIEEIKTRFITEQYKDFL